jgi:hypothetical protein
MSSMTSYEYPRIADQAKTYYMRLAQDATLLIPHDDSLLDRHLHQSEFSPTEGRKPFQAPALPNVFEHYTAQLGPRLLFASSRTHHSPPVIAHPATDCCFSQRRRVCDDGLRFYQVTDGKHHIGDDGNPKCILGHVLDSRESADDRERRDHERKYKYPH